MTDSKKGHSGKSTQRQTSEGSVSTERLEHFDNIMSRAIDYYPEGIVLQAGGWVQPRKDHLEGVKRGKVTGWSKASRRRMRRFLLTNRPPDGWHIQNVTLTIPGPPLEDPKQGKIAFQGFAKAVLMRGWCGIWRMEIQQRGALHWHCIISTPKENMAETIKELWFKMIDKLGGIAAEYTGKLQSNWNWRQRIDFDGNKRRVFLDLPSRRHWPYAGKFCCHVDQAESRHGSWMRYISDHASKTKQEQVAEGMGRHWGIVGRDKFKQVMSRESDKLTDKQYFKLLRVYRRLCTPSITVPCIFGRRLGYGPKWGMSGSTVRFVIPDTIRRLVVWCRVESPLV